jgi:protein-S-isoprenylcysteine O-methyltransferase Ste14
MIVRAFTVAGVVASMALAGLMGLSTSQIDGRFWPPGQRDWRFWVYIGLSGLPSVALPVIAVADSQTFVFAGTMWWAVGVALAGVGTGGFLAATFDLGVETSSGMEGKLQTDGFYRYSRNPQLVFLLILVVGLVLAINSPNATVVGVAMICWLVSMPFAEEPWLRDQFGHDYETYLERVPRFLGLASIRRLVEDLGV